MNAPAPADPPAGNEPPGASPHRVAPVPQAGPPPAPATSLDFPTTLSRDGRLPWAFGLLSLIGLPFLSLLAPGITMIVLGLLQRRKNPVARHVGGRAALFGAINVAVVLGYLAALIIGSAAHGGSVSFEENPLLIGGFIIPVAIYLVAIGPLLNLVLAIIALARPVSREKAEKIFSR
ncbi:hypothetical protein [Brachybacterium hainanense]|uniref:DUF4190 domain-containing protein n=1 Tax=Brachybacterium hainanense TaxID=1541174 RepID=A0ABV6RCC0_9MICO